MKPNLNKIATHPLQTSAWAEFRREWGNEILATKWGLLTVHKLPLTDHKIAIFEKGPTPTRTMLSELRTLGKQNNLIFIKLEPNQVTNKQSLASSAGNQVIKLLAGSGAVRGRRLFTPTTFWIDLTQSEDKLLKSFHPKTRYNIKLAQKQGVQVQEDNSKRAFEIYLELMRETAKRQGFYAHTEKYHRLMWKYLQPAGIAHLLAATYKKEVITTWVLFTWRDFLYYPYGASTDKYKNIMANNLIMWEAIRFGKKLGLKTFDLWGREEGKGFTRFKEGYNPKVVEFVGSWDLVINKPLYVLYRFAEFIRWPLLRLKSKLIKPKF